MNTFSRKKRVTDPFDDEAKARLFGLFEPGSVSSGSEHSAHKFDEDDVASPSFSDLLCGVLFDNESSGIMSAELKSNDSDTESLDYDSAGPIHELKLILTQDRNTDTFKDVLRVNVVKSMEIFTCVENNDNKSILRRNVMSFLRNLGYNAAICKTKWGRSGGLNAGNFEFIDVIRSDTSTRYFIELDFMSEFQLARPTKSYEEILNSLPKLFVSNEDELKRILRIVSDVARRSFKSCGLHIPPWRKHRFMQQKWFGPYRRTVNLFPASFGPVLPCDNKFAVKCRAVGFDESGVNGRLLPVTTPTR
ncbi:hypothetical protein LIER_33017 [Lithospermum erythrorhizon]|uniref:DUF506 family protein n=1 Tax=Lithospermum erythrorhizon TaxID=34254 RepID=A0AAV3RXS1_LITER